MKGLKTFIPAAVLLAGLSLAVNTGCQKKEDSKEQVIEQKIDGQYDEKRIVGGKEYSLRNQTFHEYPDKSFSVSSEVKMKKNEFRVTYDSLTDVEGKFYEDVLFLKGNSDLPYSLTIYAKRDTGLEIEKIMIYDLKNALITIDKNYKDVEKRDEYFNLGLEQLQIFNKLFDVEKKRNQSKGENLYPILEGFNIKDLTKNDFRELNSGGGNIILFAKKEPLIVFAYPYTLDPFNKYGSAMMITNRNNQSAMIIQDFKSDGIIEDVSFVKIMSYPFGKTTFEMRDDTYKYIKYLYTEDQVKEIFKDANEKFKFIDKIKNKTEG